MKKQKKKKGICTTCNNEEHCTFPRNNGSAVAQCEEFELYNGISEQNVQKKIGADSALRLSPGIKETYSSKGLCSNCENCESCVYPKPEGGVWHCEEYQ